MGDDVTVLPTVKTQSLLEPALALCWGEAHPTKLHRFLHLGRRGWRCVRGVRKHQSSGLGNGCHNANGLSLCLSLNLLSSRMAKEKSSSREALLSRAANSSKLPRKNPHIFTYFFSHQREVKCSQLLLLLNYYQSLSRIPIDKDHILVYIKKINLKELRLGRL